MAWNGGLALTLWSTRVRRPCRPSRRRPSPASMVRRRAAGRAGADLPAGPRDRRRPDGSAGCCGATATLAGRSCSPAIVGLTAAVGPPRRWPVRRGRSRGWCSIPVFRLRDGRELPRPPSWEHLDGGLQAVAEEIPPWWKVPHLSASHTLFLWFFLMLAVAVGLLGFAVWLRRRDGGRTGRSVALLAVALVSVGILPQALQRPDSAHLMWVTCVSLPFSAVAVIEALRRWRPRIDGRPAVADRRRRRRRRDVRVHRHVHVPLLPAAHARRPRPGARRVRRAARRPQLLPRRPPRPTSACRPPSTSSPAVPSPVTACSSGRATCDARGTATCSSTGCSPSSSRRRTTSRWTRAWPTPRAPAWPTTSRRPTGSS